MISKTSFIKIFKSLWKKYSLLSLPLKLIIGGFLSALGGSGVIGFLSEYAAYSYAIFYGIRPPLEGIPYLKIAITSLTLFTFFGSSLVFLLVMGLVRLGVSIFYSILDTPSTWMRILLSPLKLLVLLIPKLRTRLHPEELNLPPPSPRKLIKTHLSHRPTSQIIAISILLSVFIGILIAFEQYKQQAELTANITRSISFALISGLTLFFACKPKATFWLATIGTLLFFLASPFALFHAPTYAKLLRVLGYGGGIFVNTQHIDQQGAFVKSFEGNLVMRTSTSAIFFDKEKNKIIEFHLSKIGSIDYNVGALLSNDYSLPNCWKQNDLDETKTILKP
ncbi:MAG: hypothetical protein D3903_07265 [Candidatus Electrothrix sp. GM3_4]|nr:hypothetical protein [Candidatus Electrothrix sp. GM3_4]